MSEFHVEVVKIGKVGKHPNADTLSITNIHGGYPCIFRTGDFQEGDLAVYIPIEVTLPNTPEFAFLDDSSRRRLRAKKLRGIFSMGILIPPPNGTSEGQEVANLLGITKFEPNETPRLGGRVEKGPEGWQFFKYTDLEALRRYPKLIEQNEEVVLSEKGHGGNSRYCFDGEKLWVGSHNLIRAKEENDIEPNIWWKIANQLNLEEKLSKFPMKIFYGEILGIQDLKYGLKQGQLSLKIFDIFDVQTGKYLDFEEASTITNEAGLDFIPILYKGPWRDELKVLAEGKSTLCSEHCREGFVVKPIKEKFHPHIGRVILKCHGQDYLLRKQK